MKFLFAAVISGRKDQGKGSPGFGIAGGGNASSVFRHHIFTVIQPQSHMVIHGFGGVIWREKQIFLLRRKAKRTL